MLGFIAEGYTVSVYPFYNCTNLTPPTGNLDKLNSDKVVGLLKKINSDYGQTIILITHDEKIANIANRILHIEDGRLIDERVKN